MAALLPFTKGEDYYFIAGEGDVEPVYFKIEAMPEGARVVDSNKYGQCSQGGWSKKLGLFTPNKDGTEHYFTEYNLYYSYSGRYTIRVRGHPDEIVEIDMKLGHMLVTGPIREFIPLANDVMERRGWTKETVRAWQIGMKMQVKNLIFEHDTMVYGFSNGPPQFRIARESYGINDEATKTDLIHMLDALVTTEGDKKEVAAYKEHMKRF